MINIKYHNHTLQTNSWHPEEEPQNNNSHTTPGRQSKATSSFFPIKMSAKLEMTQSTAQQNMEQPQKFSKISFRNTISVKQFWPRFQTVCKSYQQTALVENHFFIKQEGHSGPESLTCSFFTFPLISLCKTIDPRIRAIFGPRAIIWTNMVEVH